MTADVITGPWKKIDPTEQQLEKAQILADCDSIASECVVSVLQNLVENGMAPEDPDDENIVYIMFLSEVLKAITYSNVGVDHPFQDVVYLLTGQETNVDNTKQYYIDYHAVQNAVEYLKGIGKDPA
tara:strand:- start:75 stop:452 length:378 start_codon:yes stop_codon:yes gene_type:complete